LTIGNGFHLVFQNVSSCFNNNFFFMNINSAIFIFKNISRVGLFVDGLFNPRRGLKVYHGHVLYDFLNSSKIIMLEVSEGF
jgi:hypothetical protein